MATYNPDKTPPPLSASANYDDWKKMVTLWSNFTSLPKAKQGTCILLSLKGKDQEAVLELKSEEINCDDGFDNVVAQLDKLYLKDKTLQKYQALEDFNSYRRPASTPINEFIIEFEKRHHKCKTYGSTIADDSVAFRLLKCTNLQPADEKLVRGTVGLTYEPMKDQLKKLFSESTNLLSASIDSMASRVEDININESYGEDQIDTYYTRVSPRRQWRGNYNNYASRSRGAMNSNWRAPSPSHSPSPKSTSPMNPVDRHGNITRCIICESVMHWTPNCQHLKTTNSTLFTHELLPTEVPPPSGLYEQEEYEIVLHQSDHDSPQHMDTLISESTGCAVLDCGASKTVAGAVWWKMLYDSFPPEQQKQCRFSSSDRFFKFGDGVKYRSIVQVNFPGKIGRKNVRIEADIVDADVPLLFSKDSMKKAGMTVNFMMDNLIFQGQILPLTVSQSGHYILPITEAMQALHDPQTKSNITFSTQSGELSKGDIARKLHRQFAHAPSHRVVRLLKNSGDPWENDKDLHTEVETYTYNCDTCARYRRPPPRPVVGLPLASKFLECVSFDLIFINEKTIIHFIDQATRLSAASRIPNKKPETVVGAILKHWIGIFGSAATFHTDNGGEFVNEDLIQLAQQFGISLNTTAAYSPWSNGTIERHNLVLVEMVEKVIADTKCHFDVALAWAVNAKNSLANVHGFTPYQLVMGQNPPLPSILTAQPPAYTTNTDTFGLLTENLNALHSAREAFMKADNSSRIRRALKQHTNIFRCSVSPG